MGSGQLCMYCIVLYSNPVKDSKADFDHQLVQLSLLLKGVLRTFALIVCAQRYCAGNATVICHALLSEVQVLKPLQKP